MARTTEPISVTQGEQIEWTRTFEDYPATEWTLQYRFRGPDTGFNIAGTANGTDFDAVMTAAQSLAADFGTWKWQAWVTNIATPATVLMIDAGVTQILQGFPVGTAEIDLRSPAKIALDSIDAALLAFSSSDVLEYEITTPAGSRRVKRSDKAQLLSMRKYWAMIVRRENAAEAMRNGDKWGTTIKVRMP